MAELNFTEEDIRRQLELLGYHDVPRHRLAQFARDLEKLIEDEELSLQTDDSLYSDLSSQIDTSTERSPLNDIPKQHTHRPTVTSSRTGVTQTKYDQENRPSPDPMHLRKDQPTGMAQRAATSNLVDSRVYDPYQRRTKQAADKKVPMKRKVVRKKNGQSQIFDESVTESESDVSYLNERLMQLPLEDDESETSSIGYSGYRTQRPHTSQDLYSHRPSGDEDGIYKPHLPRSFIRPSSANPTWRHSKKTDPVTRHQMYQAQWNAQKAPGEKNHKGLRWSVREHMMYKDEVVQPRSNPRAYVPNTYVVPTDKKRQALRWAVRTHLAHREMPSTSFNF